MKGFFIYMFLDQEETPLYIGQSINLINRIEKQHFLSEYGNLSEDCIHKTKQVLYHECISADDMKIKERYLINTLSPEFNIALNNKSKFSFSIDIDWKYLPLNTEGILEKKEEKKMKKIEKERLIEASKTLHLSNIYEVQIKNINTQTNAIYKAYIPSYLVVDYLKIEVFRYQYLIFCIKNDLYIHTNDFELHNVFTKESPTYGVQKFNKEGFNKNGLRREDYLILESIGFKEHPFFNVFMDMNEKKMAEIDGYPIICKDKELEELYEYGCYYEDTFQLIKYDSLLKLNLLSERVITEINKTQIIGKTFNKLEELHKLV